MKRFAARGAWSLCLLLLSLAVAATPARAQETGTAFADGLTVGGGISFYLGDLDTNPENDILKFIGSSNLNLLIGLDKRYGNYSLGLEFQYDRIAGERQFGDNPYSFTNNAVSVDVVAGYGLPFVRPGLFRVFLGGGPLLLVGPQYDGFSEDTPGFKDLGTRVTANVKLGVVIQEAVRVGLMVTTTDFLDGFEGSYAPQDFLTYITLSYRFDLAD